MFVMCVYVHVSSEGFSKVMAFFNKLIGGSKSPKSPKAPVEISGPCDLRHEIHVQWDGDGVLQGLPDSWRLWMRAANIRYVRLPSVMNRSVPKCGNEGIFAPKIAKIGLRNGYKICC